MLLTLQCDSIKVGGGCFPVEGAILVKTPKDIGELRYGDTVCMRGYLRTPRDQRNPGEFDYRQYLRSQDIYGILYVRRADDLVRLAPGRGNWVLRRVIYPVKAHLDGFIRRSMPQPEAGLLRGLIIGERGDIEPVIRNAFANTGVVHILAVSGLHVGFIMLLTMVVTGLCRLPYRYRVFTTILLLVFYACLTGLKPPVVRASIMGGLFLLATILERRSDGYNTLAFAALLLLLWQPKELFQPGFQLSFTAVFAIMYFYPRMSRMEFLRPLRSVLWLRYSTDLLLVSLAAFIGTLPATVYYFNRLPLISLAANLLVIPLTFVSVATGFTAVAANLVWPDLAALYAQTSWLALRILLQFVEYVSRLPFAFIEVYDISALDIVFYVAGVLALSCFGRPRVRRWLVIGTLVYGNLLVWQDTGRPGRDGMSVTFLDVGQGDAALVSFPDDRHILIDAGFRSPDFDSGSWTVVPFLKRQGIHELAAVVMSHADADHLGGIPAVLRQLRVHEVWDNGQDKGSDLYREYLALIDSLGIRRRRLLAGDIIADFSPAQVFVVHPTPSFLMEHPDDINAGSLVLKIRYGQVDFLFSGDAEVLGEKAMVGLGSLLESEVLKVGHHGSRTSSGAAFLADVKPSHAVISAGAFNKFGHPHDEVVQRLQELPATVLRTDEEAALIFVTDGESLRRVKWN
jgi:competence protein ComEC